MTFSDSGSVNYGPGFYGGTAGYDFFSLGCPYCDYETKEIEVGEFYCYDCELDGKTEDIDDHLEHDAEPMGPDKVLEELEFQLYELHPENCSKMERELENPKSRVFKQANRAGMLRWEAETFDDLMSQTVSVECDRCGKSTEASVMSVNWAKSRSINMKHLCNSCSQDAYIDAEKYGLINRAEDSDEETIADFFWDIERIMSHYAGGDWDWDSEAHDGKLEFSGSLIPLNGENFYDYGDEYTESFGAEVSLPCFYCGNETLTDKGVLYYRAQLPDGRWDSVEVCLPCLQAQHESRNAESVYDYVTQKDRTCAWCGATPNFMVYDLPTGPHAFCTELHYTRFVGLDERPPGYYGFEAENFNKNNTITNKEIKLLAIGILATIMGTFFSEVLIDRYRENPELVDNGEQNA